MTAAPTPARRLPRTRRLWLWLGASAAALAAAPAAVVASEWVMAVRMLQKYADGYSVTLADSIYHGTPVPRVKSVRGIGVRVEHPPVAGAYAGSRDAVRVHLDAPWRPRLLPIVGERRIAVRATASMMRDGRPGGEWLMRVE